MAPKEEQKVFQVCEREFGNIIYKDSLTIGRREVSEGSLMQCETNGTLWDVSLESGEATLQQSLMKVKGKSC